MATATTAAVEPEIVAAEPVIDKLAAEIAHQNLLQRMQEHYRTEKRVRVKVRAKHDVPVQVNGYTFVIQPNVSVEVPESIATILEEAGYI